MRLFGLLLLCLVHLGLSRPFGSITSCKQAGQVALTFDDGPSLNDPIILNLLSKEHVPATFFVIGKNISHKNVLSLKQIHDKGHLLANHSWNHSDLTKLTDDKLNYEIQNVQNMLELLGEKRKYLRPPYGKLDQITFNKLVEKGFKVVFWNLDTKDWIMRRNRDKLWTSYVSAFKAADPTKDSFIIVQHNRRLDSIILLPELIKLIKTSGFTPVTLDKCVN